MSLAQELHNVFKELFDTKLSDGLSSDIVDFNYSDGVTIIPTDNDVCRLNPPSALKKVELNKNEENSHVVVRADIPYSLAMRFQQNKSIGTIYVSNIIMSMYKELSKYSRDLTGAKYIKHPETGSYFMDREESAGYELRLVLKKEVK